MNGEPSDPPPGAPPPDAPGGSLEAPSGAPYRVDYGDSEAHRLALVAALGGGGLTPAQLWMRAFGLGSGIGPADLDAYLEGLMPLPARDRDVLAQAMNERLAELAGPVPVPFSRDLRPPRPTTGPAAALVTMLEGARYCPPERLPLLAGAATLALGVGRATLYLADYEQRHLTPMSGWSPEGDLRLPVEGSMAGRAFRTGRTVTAVHEAPARYWIPVLDGDERLGVLEVELTSRAQLDDPHLREQCEWVAALTGHLVTGLDRHGDSVDALRRDKRRTAGAELAWGLLPPLTAGVDSLVVSGLLAPAEDLGGDLFDYALSQDTAHLAVFDAMGHGLRAGVMAAAAVSTYRAARRAGLDLVDQAAAIDRTLADLFPDAYATAVLARVDLRSGQVTYLNAGHPRPMLMRTGAVVGALSDGVRLPLGLQHLSGSHEHPRLGHVALEPGDWLALHTDGVTEARAADGSPFGDRRLADFLERAVADGQPPPETVRRLLAAVLGHQDGLLQDDATLLLARWEGTGTPRAHNASPGRHAAEQGPAAGGPAGAGSP